MKKNRRFRALGPVNGGVHVLTVFLPDGKGSVSRNRNGMACLVKGGDYLWSALGLCFEKRLERASLRTFSQSFRLEKEIGPLKFTGVP